MVIRQGAKGYLCMEYLLGHYFAGKDSIILLLWIAALNFSKFFPVS